MEWLKYLVVEKTQTVVLVNNLSHGAEYKTSNLGFFENNYNNGMWHGIRRHWNANSILIYRYNYKYGQKHGVQYDWYDSGKISYKNNYIHGLLDGMQYSWYHN